MNTGPALLTPCCKPSIRSHAAARAESVLADNVRWTLERSGPRALRAGPCTGRKRPAAVRAFAKVLMRVLWIEGHCGLMMSNKGDCQGRTYFITPTCMLPACPCCRTVKACTRPPQLPSRVHFPAVPRSLARSPRRAAACPHFRRPSSSRAGHCADPSHDNFGGLRAEATSGGSAGAHD